MKLRRATRWPSATPRGLATWWAFRTLPAAAPRSGLNTQYVCPKGCDRDAFAATLKAQGIPTSIYYSKSVHQQTVYRDFPVADGGLPVSERLSVDVISLPMHAYLDEPTQERIIKAVRGASGA